VRYAVVGEASEVRIDDLLASSDATDIPPSVKKAKDWLHDHLAENGETLRNDVITAGRAAGHAQPAIVQAKAISTDTIGHTPQGTGRSKWFLIELNRLRDRAR